MQPSLSTACLVHLPLRRVLRLAAECGFGGVELSVNPEVWWGGAARVRRLAREHGLEIFSVHQTLLPAMMAPDRAKMLDATRTALAVGASRVVIHGPDAHAWNQPAAQAWLRELASCREAAAEGGVLLALENPGAGHRGGAPRLFSRLEEQMEFVRRHDLRVTLDTCHAGTSGLDLLAACDQIGERLANLHFSDLRPNPGVRNPPAERPGLGRRLGTAWQATHTLFAHHQMPGPGGLPLDTLLRHLAQMAYAGPVTMEINPFALRAWQPGQVPARLQTLVSIVAAVQPASPACGR